MPIREDEWGSIWVGSEMISCRSEVVMRISGRPSGVTMYFDHHDGDIPLKSPKIVIKWQVNYGNSFTIFSTSKIKSSNSLLLTRWKIHNSNTSLFSLNVTFTKKTLFQRCNAY